jgi:hypothetical protein
LFWWRGVISISSVAAAVAVSLDVVDQPTYRHGRRRICAHLDEAVSCASTPPEFAKETFE